MPVLTEGNRLSDVLVNEYDQSFCRERFVAEGDIAIGQPLQPGTSATTQKKAVVAAGTNTDCVALNNAKSGEAVICLVRGPAIVRDTGIVYTSGATDQQKVDTRALLLAKNIKVTTQIV